MIRYLKNESINYERWDACIAQSFNSRLYAHSWYLDVVSPEWNALVYGDYEAVMPLPQKSKLGISLILQPYFCQQLGIFCSTFISKELETEFLDSARTHARVIRLNLNSEHAHWDGKTRANYVLPLAAPFDLLAKNFNKLSRRNIKKSKDNSCTLMEHLSMKDIMDLFRWQAKEKKMGLRETDFQRFEHLLNSLIAKGKLFTVGVYSPVNHLCACGLFMKDDKRLYYLYGASDQMGIEYKGMFRIMDHVIRSFAEQDLLLDFEGSEIPGVARFFAGLGATNRPYPVFESYRMGILNPIIRSKFGA